MGRNGSVLGLKSGVMVSWLSPGNEGYRVTAQMVLVCCWRSMKEVAMLLGQLCQSLPLHCSDGSSQTHPGLITEAQVRSWHSHSTVTKPQKYFELQLSPNWTYIKKDKKKKSSKKQKNKQGCCQVGEICSRVCCQLLFVMLVPNKPPRRTQLLPCFMHKKTKQTSQPSFKIMSYLGRLW